MKSKNVKKAAKVFHGLNDEQKEIALRYLENKILGKDKENEEIRRKLGLETTAD